MWRRLSPSDGISEWKDDDDDDDDDEDCPPEMALASRGSSLSMTKAWILGEGATMIGLSK